MSAGSRRCGRSGAGLRGWAPGPGSGAGDRPDPGTPASEVCTCRQPSATFLPRRTRFWSAILRATKRRSPPWTSAPAANNSVSVLLPFCEDGHARRVGNRAARAPCAAGAPPGGPGRGSSAAGDARTWVASVPPPSRAPAGAWPATFANSPPGGVSGKGRGLVLGPGRVGCWRESL